MKRNTGRSALPLVLVLLVAFAGGFGCAKKIETAEPVAAVEQEETIPPAPMAGVSLARAAERIPITNGPSTPVRRVLSQEPQARPCWAVPEGAGCPLDKPGSMAFVGMSSGAVTKEGAILNAYQNAIERLATHCLKMAGKSSVQAREKVRAKAYQAAGIHTKDYRLQEGTWVQQWEELYRDYKRTYYRAFVLLVVSEAEIQTLKP